MAIPTNPTLNEIILSALFDAGERDPLDAVTDQALNWAEEIKADLYRECKKLKDLQMTSYGVLNQGQSRYSFPSDYGTDITMTLLEGQLTGTATAGGSGSITLSASLNQSSDYMLGKGILITSGTGVASYSQITGWDNSTKVATVTPNFKTAPSSGSTYLIVTEERMLDKEILEKYSKFQKTYVDKPSYFFPMGDEDYGEFILDCPPDKVYGVRLHYFGNIMRVDDASTQISNLYSRYRNVFLAGIRYRKFAEAMDDREALWLQKYQSELVEARRYETYGREGVLQTYVADFS